MSSTRTEITQARRSVHFDHGAHLSLGGEPHEPLEVGAVLAERAAHARAARDQLARVDVER